MTFSDGFNALIVWKDLPPEQLQDPEFEPCRYKLLIDATEDGGALRMLQALQLVPEGVLGNGWLAWENWGLEACGVLPICYATALASKTYESISQYHREAAACVFSLMP